MMTPETIENGQEFSTITQRIVGDLNYLTSEDAGLRTSQTHAGDTFIGIHFRETPVVIPEVVVARGIALYAGCTSYTIDGKPCVEAEFAYLEDNDTLEAIEVPLLEGTLRVNPVAIEQWDELKKQRALTMSNRLLRMHFSASQPNG